MGMSGLRLLFRDINIGLTLIVCGYSFIESLLSYTVIICPILLYLVHMIALNHT